MSTQRTTRLIALLSGALATGAVLCGHAGAKGLNLDPCPLAKPDATLTLPAAKAAVVKTTSPNGSYSDVPCPFYAADITVGPGQDVTLEGRFAGKTSAAQGYALWPNLAVAIPKSICPSYRQYVAVYRRNALSPTFTKVSGRWYTGKWSPGTPGSVDPEIVFHNRPHREAVPASGSGFASQSYLTPRGLFGATTFRVVAGAQTKLLGIPVWWPVSITAHYTPSPPK